MEDVLAVDIDTPVAELRAVDPYQYSVKYSKALESEAGRDALTAARRSTWAMLAAIMGMHMKPEDERQPFAAQITFGDGRRSAIPADFIGTPSEAMAEIATRAKHLAVRTRVSDVCWLLDRKRNHLGRAALAGYVEILGKLQSGEFTSILSEQRGERTRDGRDILHRALTLSRQLGWDTVEAISARTYLNALREAAFAAKEIAPILWSCELALKFAASDPAQIGEALETCIGQNIDSNSELELWRLASWAYHNAKDQSASNRCKVGASDCLVVQADIALERMNSAMHAAHSLSMAIAQLHGVPKMKERLRELRHKLIDVQARVPDEMSPYFHPIDLREIVEKTENAADKLSAKDLLFFFASLTKSPDPEVLLKEAARAIEDSPLPSLFGSTHHDDEGKVIFRAHDDASAIQVQIAQHENTRRFVCAKSQIDTVRRNLNSRFYIHTALFRSFLQRSPFVPPDSLDTYSRGFSRFFEGDFTGAIYILTPMLENSLRYVLKSHDHEVTAFDINTQLQEDKTISALFKQMRPELDAIFGKALTTDIDNVFLSKPGPSLRHAVAHGLLRDGGAHGHDAIYGCWLIFRLCSIPLFAEADSVHVP
jgi:hypothetical protein